MSETKVAPPEYEANPTSSTVANTHQDSEAGGEGELKGTRRIEETLWSKQDMIIVFVGLFLLQFGSNLEESMTYNAVYNIVSLFDALWGTVYLSTVPSILNAAFKLCFAKFADAFGRKETILVSCVLTVVSYILLFISDSFVTFFVGQMIQSVGATALFVVSSILLADLIPILLRGSFTAYLNIPLFFNGFLSPVLAGALLASNFRWIFGIGSILWALGIVCVLFGLIRAERRWRSQPAAASAPPKPKVKITWEGFKTTIAELDVLGLVLLAVGTILILVPLNLNTSVAGGWSSPIILGPLIAGLLMTFVLFPLWEFRFAKHPVVPFRLIRNPTAAGTLAVHISVYMAANTAVYWFNPYVRVTKGVDLVTAGLLQYGYTAGFAVGTIAVGWLMQWTGNYRRWMWVGLLGFALSMGLLINGKGASTADYELAIVQALAGLTAGIAVNASSIALQGSVAHADLALGITMKDFLVFYGGALGGAVGGTLWNRLLPTILTERIANSPTELGLDVVKVVNDLTYVLALSPAELEVVRASYVDTQRYASIVGVCISAIGIFGAFFMKSLDLKALKQTAVEMVDEKKPTVEGAITH
ncbi:major facilitator superfamily domain-containing protein [Cladochytrium replicatum]|nr:major facilitator superfamily domain-containing protein [Cladochytrium replicatum]